VVEFCILGLLNRGPSYGWAIAEELIGRGLIGGIGTLYPAIKRLRDTDFIRLASADDRRRTYRITAKGRKALVSFASDWPGFANAVVDCVADEVKG
jgi:PadR family transcriptional regulator PadR